MKNKYQALFENSITALFITRPDGTILEANEAACCMFGYTKEEFRKLGRKGVIDPDSPGLVEKLKEREQTGSVSGELIGVRKNGEKFWCEFSSSVFDDSDGGKMGSVMLIDVSGKKDLQERRKEQTTLYNIAKLNEIELTVDELLNESVKILKKGFINLKFTGIRITYMGKEYSSDNFEESDKKLTAQSTSSDGYTLKIEAVIQDKEVTKNINFIEEENELTEAVAELLSLKLYQKETRLNLEKSNERFRYINQVTQEVIYEHDFETDEITLSENFEKIFGYSFADEEFTLEKWALNLHPEDRDEINSRLEKVLENKDANKWQAEFRYARKDGSYAYVFENSYIIRDKNGNVVRMIGSVKDITDQKVRELQKSLIADVSLSFNQADSLTDGLNKTLSHIIDVKSFELAELWVTDRDNKQVQLIANHYAPGVSEQFQPAAGETPLLKKGKGLPGSSWKKKKPLFWRNLDKRKTFLRNKLAKAAGLKTGFAYPVMDGDEVTGVLVLAVKEDLKTEPYYSPIFRELADQLASEIKRKQLEEQLNRIFSSSPDIISLANTEGYFKKINPAMAEMLEYSEEELLSKPYIEFVHPDDRKSTDVEIQNLRKGEPVYYFKNRYITKSGNIKWIAWTATSYPDENLVLAVGKDITEQQKLQELLDQANRLARIGSWEVDLMEEKLYWSDITKEIHEVKPDYEPDLESAIHFYKDGESRDKIREALNRAIQHGDPWDLELQIITAKDNEKWVRAIGEAEIVDGKCIKVYGSFQDIHDMKVAETRLENIADNLPGVMFQYWLTPDGNDSVHYLSEGSNEVWGVSAEDAMEDFDRVWANAHKDDVEGIRESIIKSAESLKQWHYTWRYNLPNGSLRWQEGFGTPQKLADGTVVWDSIVLDITDRKEAQEQIIEKTRKLDAIATFNSLLIKEDSWEVALEKSFPAFGEIVNCDRVYYFNNVSGQDGEQTVTLTQEWVKEGISPQIDNPSHHNVPHSDIWDFVEPLINGKPFNYAVKDIEDKEFRELLKSQDIKSLLALPVFTGAEFQGFIGFDDCTTGRTWRDEEITFLQTISINLASAIENEEAEEALQKAFEEKNEILESIGDAFFALDHDWTVTYWNHMAEKVLHMPREKILGENLWDLYEDATSLEFYTQYHKAVREQVNVQFEEYYPALEKWFEVSAYPSSMGLSVFFKDVTERKKADERLKELNRELEQQTQELAVSNAELEQFAFVASHDLQEPLRMITSFLAQLERKYGDVLDEKGKKYIHFATDGAKRMRQIILDLLDYSRVGRIDTDRDEVDVNEILDVVKRLHKKKIEETKATITWEEMPVISAASGPIQQLFQNLINNALSYHKKGNKPVVKIWPEETEDHWKFYVKDNGIGIKPEYSDKIFNIFQRLHGKEEYSGTGVGLAICKKIVEDHGGEIGVESEPGKGSTFYFTIQK